MAKLQAENSSLQQKLSLGKRRHREHERSSDMLQKRLDKEVERTEKRRAKEAAIFEKLTRRRPNKHSHRDSEILSIISMYEHQHQHLNNEIKFLKQELREMTGMYKENVNVSYVNNSDDSDDDQTRSGSKNRKHSKKKHSKKNKKQVRRHRIKRRAHTTSPFGASSPTSSSSSSSSACASPNGLPEHVVRRRWQQRARELEMEQEESEAFRRRMTRLHREQVQEMEALRAEMRRKELQFIHEVQSADDRVSTLRRENAKLERENDQLKTENAARPTIQEWRSAQSKITKLQKKVSQTRSLREMSKYMDTKELMKRDRDLYRLHLRQLENLPREVAVEILQDVCRELELTDVSLAVPSIRKMSRVVAAVPSMEMFIRRVTKSVHRLCVRFDKALPQQKQQLQQKQNPSSQAMIEQVVPTIDSWEVDFQRLLQLEEFAVNVRAELSQRLHPTASSSASAAAGTAATTAVARTPSQMLKEVEELVSSENQVMRSRDVHEQAQQFANAHPQELTSRIIHHFKHLFDVRDMQGIFPKMNWLYMFVNTTNNSSVALRQELGLSDDATFTDCVEAIRQLRKNAPLPVAAAKRHKNTDNTKEAAEVGGLEDQTRGLTFIPVGDGEADREHQEQGKHLSKAYAYSVMMRKLKEILQVHRDRSVLPVATRLVRRLKMFDEIFPHLDQLVAQLYSLLKVTHMHDIVPSIERLIRQSEQ
eukprot:TRINITY_DN65978_c3_g1_i1.p1 TRINITY_DN65978_c3_g1~~TRINITY_DN65978_c3_g1_i1.p1  ORF type:complete len:773 (-),score=413.80 TRINITY_DN65978_c3_g1_i1:36-2156(-)